MESNAKYFPQTSAALQSLKETAALLDEAASESTAKNNELNEKLTILRQQINEKVSRIDSVIETLSKAVK